MTPVMLAMQILDCHVTFRNRILRSEMKRWVFSTLQRRFAVSRNAQYRTHGECDARDDK